MVLGLEGIFKFISWSKDNNDLSYYLEQGWEPIELDSYRDQYGCAVFWRCCRDL